MVPWATSVLISLSNKWLAQRRCGHQVILLLKEVLIPTPLQGLVKEKLEINGHMKVLGYV